MQIVTVQASIEMNVREKFSIMDLQQVLSLIYKESVK